MLKTQWKLRYVQKPHVRLISFSAKLFQVMVMFMEYQGYFIGETVGGDKFSGRIWINSLLLLPSILSLSFFLHLPDSSSFWVVGES